MRACVHTGISLIFSAIALAGSAPKEEESLRLIPFPKEVMLSDGCFALDTSDSLTVSGSEADFQVALIREELKRAGLPEPALKKEPGANHPSLVWGTDALGITKPPHPSLPEASKAEGYTLSILPGSLTVNAETEAGLFHGIQTLCQLIRSNRTGNRLPCLSIRDWPSLRWRCFQDDLTRGPSTRPDMLTRQLDLGAMFKHNLFTYYMEHQFAWKKHPAIGPTDGSLSADELKALVEHGQRAHIDILGNQQSFGHFGNILKHEKYAGLRETPDILCPVKDESYRLLDDLYSEVVPLLPLPFFNVCCDETFGLGEGPSKELATKIGLGGVYAQHLRRIHDLLKEKYGKRMMMWGDIILQHPDHLKEIPSDTILLTWGYAPRASFEDQILPFAQSGYEFFVCPGVNNWRLILPDFTASLTNIRNFVRDGTRHGALGMLNTAWDDDGENFNAPSWPGYAWGAECAWSGSTTEPEAFNRRIGAVLFGEPGDHFGQALELLAKTHALPGMQGMKNERFWHLDLTQQQSSIASANRLLAIVRPAISHLEACRKEATANADLLDYFLFGAKRMEWIGQRLLETAAAAQTYQEACELPLEQADALLGQTESAIRKLRDTHETLGNEFAALWLRENRPFALDRITERYATAVATYDALLQRLATARADLKTGKPLPSARELGLEFVEPGKRNLRPDRVMQTALQPDAAWLEPRASHRMGLVVDTGSIERAEQPIEVEVRLPDELFSKPVRAFLLLEGGKTEEVPAQLDSASRCLTLVLRSRLPKGTKATVWAYLGLPETPSPLPCSAITTDAATGMKWLENDKVRLLLGPEGAHLFRWELKALSNRDLTMPGEKSWLGFADLGGERRSPINSLVCTAQGPALVRYCCTDELGTEKTISLYAGASWVEIALNDAPSYFWAFDDPRNFAADGPTPGEYLFSTGVTGKVGRQSDGVSAQVKANRSLWGVKFLPGKIALGLVTPGRPARHVIAPGSGAGGVGIEGGTGASQFILYGGTLDGEPAALMQRLAQTLDCQKRPAVTVNALQPRFTAP